MAVNRGKVNLWKADVVRSVDFYNALIRRSIQVLSVPVIAEGRIWTPEQLGKVLPAGAYTALVGSAITRPQLIAKRFSDAMASYTEDA